MRGIESSRAQAEPLERRLFLTAFTVSTTADIGTGSLRAAIGAANLNSSGLTTIVFNLPAGVQTITPLTALPAITGQVDIVGTTDSSGNPQIVLDGHLAGDGVDGLIFNRAASSDTKPSTVSGLVIDRFSEDGIRIQGSGPTDVFGCRIGTDFSGKHSHPNAGDGILVNASGCLIGTDVTGKLAAPNGGQGILITASDVLIGGRRAHQGNVISGNLGQGILADAGVGEILGNRIGTNATGTKAIANQLAGIDLDNVANVIVGDGTVAGSNVISANAGDGITAVASSNCTINNNFIGTDITGTAAMGNSLEGIALNQSAQISVMDSTVGDCNKGISTNNCSDINISGCTIGIDESLQHPLSNGLDGIELTATTNSNIQSNTIADNGTNGIEVDDSNSTGDRLDPNNIFSNQHLGI